MNDPQIRLAFHNKILRKAHLNSDTFILDEFSLRNGEIRADIAVLNGKLIGYEIKTEKDTLQRLESQMIAYSEVFDQAYIISSENHLPKALEIIPKWWGIYLIKQTKNGKFLFLKYRTGLKNIGKDGLGISQLLWKDEVISILESQFQIKIKSKQTKCQLYAILTEVCDTQTLSNIALDYLKKRNCWRLNQKLL
ncbi:MAG: sce7726 family protein [Bacteroidota bacterium]